MVRLAPAWLAAALVAGCGGDDAPDISVNGDNVCEEMAEVACYNLYRCCAESEIEDFLGVTEARSEEECRRDVQRVCERNLATLDWSIEEGRAEFDADVMTACLEALIAPEDTCALVETAPPWAEACMASAWLGTVGVDDECFYSYECAGIDAYCAGNRRCAELPGRDEPCSPLGCASGLYCAAGTCAPLLGDGDPCAAGNECAEGLFCDFAAGGGPTCAALRGAGEACTSDAMCESTECLPGVCAVDGSSCLGDDGCAGHCADDASFCFDDGDCGAGTCSISDVFCDEELDCVSGADDTCVFPVACTPGDCLGEPVCADRFVTVDYCQGALGDLPLP